MEEKIQVPINPDEIIDEGFYELDPKYYDEIDEAEKEIDEKYGKSKLIHIRLAPYEIERAKKLAAKKGLKYQTYIKMILKQGMDKDEQVG